MDRRLLAGLPILLCPEREGLKIFLSMYYKGILWRRLLQYNCEVGRSAGFAGLIMGIGAGDG